MGLYRRKSSGVWWARVWHQGREIRRSSGTRTKRVAQEFERKLRDELTRESLGLTAPRKNLTFTEAAQRWLASKAGLSARTRSDYEKIVARIDPVFGRNLVSRISLEEIAAYQRERVAGGLGARRMNYEISVLRQVLAHEGQWERLRDRVHWYREPKDIGRALAPEEEARLLEAAGESGSPALLPLVVLSLDTGLRRSELRRLRYCDMTLEWRAGVLSGGWLKVGKAKTAAGEGRTVPLSHRVIAVLSLWLSRPELELPKPTHFVFPEHAVSVGSGVPKLYKVRGDRPIGDWKTAWNRAQRLARVELRWHDLRHTFVTRLAENPNVSEQTIRSLAGHVSREMLDRYSHVRNRAKEEAIRALGGEQPAQKPAHDGFGRNRQDPTTPRIH